MDNLKGIIERQKELLNEFEAEQKAIEGSDLVKENVQLKAELEKLRVDFEHLSAGAAQLSDENKGLKNALYDQVYNEKIKIVDTTKQKLEIYFKNRIGGEMNRLSVIESNILSRIRNMREVLNKNGVALDNEMHARLDEASELLDRTLTEMRGFPLPSPRRRKARWKPLRTSKSQMSRYARSRKRTIWSVLSALMCLTRSACCF